MITLGNGSNDILELVTRAFVGPQHEVISANMRLRSIPIVTQAVGAKAVVVPRADWGHDLAAMLAAIDAEYPSGVHRQPEQPDRYLDSKGPRRWSIPARVPEHVLVVLDEAYIEYAERQRRAGRSGLPGALPEPAGVAHLLQGLRPGRVCASVTAFASRAIADVLNRVRQPFNVNSLALAAACAALQDDEYLAESRRLNRDRHAATGSGLPRAGAELDTLRGNFIA